MNPSKSADSHVLQDFRRIIIFIIKKYLKTYHKTHSINGWMHFSIVFYYQKFIIFWKSMSDIRSQHRRMKKNVRYILKENILKYISPILNGPSIFVQN